MLANVLVYIPGNKQLTVTREVKVWIIAMTPDGFHDLEMHKRISGHRAFFKRVESVERPTGWSMGPFDYHLDAVRWLDAVTETRVFINKGTRTTKVYWR